VPDDVYALVVDRVCKQESDRIAELEAREAKKKAKEDARERARRIMQGMGEKQKEEEAKKQEAKLAAEAKLKRGAELAEQARVDQAAKRDASKYGQRPSTAGDIGQ